MPNLALSYARAVLNNLTGPVWQRATGGRGRNLVKQFTLLGLGELNEARAFRKVAERSAAVTLLGGSSTRYLESLESLRSQQEAPLSMAEIDQLQELPRCFAPVNIGGEVMPVGRWAIRVMREIRQNGGLHVVVVDPDDGHQQKIKNEIVIPEKADAQYVVVQPRVKVGDGYEPLGHADALWHVFNEIPRLKTFDNIMINFCSDPNSPDTIKTSLMTLAALRQLGEEVGSLMPVAYFPPPDKPNYPLCLDGMGRPVRFIQPRVKSEAVVGDSSNGNIGLWLFSVPHLLRALNFFRGHYIEIKPGEWGYDQEVTGNLKRDLCLDNIGQFLLDRELVRILSIADPFEIRHTFKKYDDRPGFEEDLNLVLEKNPGISDKKCPR